jgi:hypothetical protein
LLGAACADNSPPILEPVLPMLQLTFDENQPIVIHPLDGVKDPQDRPLTIVHAVANYQPVTIGENGQSLELTPKPNFSGTLGITYQVSTGGSAWTQGTITITVRPVNDPPVAIAGTIAAIEDQRIAIVLRGGDSDSDSNVLNFLVTAAPQHGTLTGSPPNLSYLPAQNYNGDDELTFVVSDGNRSSTPATVAIHVAPVNDPPIVMAKIVAVNEDSSVAITLAGSDAEGDALSFYIVGSPANGTLSPLNGASVTYWPRRDFNGGDAFAFAASDGHTTSMPRPVTINVAPTSDPPNAFDQFVYLNEDGSATITLNSSDPDGDALSTTVTSAPQHGTLTGTPPFLIYRPSQEYNGSDSFTFTATDSSSTSPPATVSLQIAPVNDAPVAQSLSVTLDEDTPVTFALAATDVDSASFSYAVYTAPSDGQITRSGANLTYTPAPNANGMRALTYYAHDGNSSSSLATVTLQITPRNDNPTTADDYLATDPSTPVTFTATGNDVDPDGDPLQLDSVDAADHGTVEMVDGNVVYTPDDGFTGTDTFGYTVVDSHGAAATGQIHISVGSFPAGLPTETIATVIADPGYRDDAPSISGDGRYIAFVTGSALIPEDTNGAEDVYVYDRGHRTMARVSVASNGDQANAFCHHPVISANGRYVVFDSAASNLVAGDGNGTYDVFRHDRATGETIRISVPFTEPGIGGGTMATISDDGDRVAFSSTAFDLISNDANGARDVFVRDVAAGTTTRVSASITGSDGDQASGSAMISGDGRRGRPTSSRGTPTP